MALTIQVTSYKKHAPVNALSTTINESGCIIGRATTNGFVLPDMERIVSHRHATINFENGTYYLTDTSTNGTYLNYAPTPIGAGNKVPLHNGDVLSMGKYDCVVSVSEQENSGINSSFNDALLHPPQHENMQPSSWGNQSYLEPAVQTPPQNSQSPTPAIEQDYFQPPEAIPEEQNYFQPPEAIPEDWNEETGNKPEDRPAIPNISQPLKKSHASASIPIQPQEQAPQSFPEDWNEVNSNRPENSPPIPDITEHALKPHATASKPVQPQAPQSFDAQPVSPIKRAATTAPRESNPAQNITSLDQQAVNAFLDGAGLTDIRLKPEEIPDFMNSAGQILREMTQGFKQVLDDRANLKGEFRLGMTTLNTAHNNPLKFSIDVEDALSKLLITPPKGYLPPLEAIHEATDDLQAHQMALLAGLRAALRSLVALFDPEKLEKNFQKASAVDNILPPVRKAKYWDKFKTRYKKAATDAENDFLHFLGDEFTIAYEQQVEKLKHVRQKVKM